MGDDVIAPQPMPIHNESPAIWPLVIEDMQSRDRFGRAKYGTPLQVNNGRCMAIDAYQEALDLVVYLKGMTVEMESLRAEVTELRGTLATCQEQLQHAHAETARALGERDKAEAVLFESERIRCEQAARLREMEVFEPVEMWEESESV